MLSKKVSVIGKGWGYNSESILEVESAGLIEWLMC